MKKIFIVFYRAATGFTSVRSTITSRIRSKRFIDAYNYSGSETLFL
ncbi:MAG TPA: hypothetical protein VGD22_10575 [Sphingobacteriaceae bacterium]